MMSNIPKLRFPEFKGEWEEKRIDSIFDEQKEKNHPTEDVLTIIQGTGTVPRKESGRNIIFDEKSLSNYKFVQKDDFIIHLRSFEGGLEIANSNGIVSPAYIIMRPKLSIASKFFYSYFRSYNFINHVLPVAVEGVRDGRQIKYPILKEEKIPFTSFAEQQKIADFLSNVDSIIAVETKILNTLQKKEKALMQKLFSQQLRFKSDDGTDFPAWEEKKLGECVISISSGKNKKKNSAGNFPVYGSMGIIGYSEQYVYNKDCILVARVGANAGTLHIAKGKYDVSDNTLIIELNENELLSFYYFLLVNINLNKLNYGTGQPLVTSGMLKNIDIQLPCKAEQQKIADCLSSMDSLIQTQQNVVTTWQQRKKALLQQMFI